MAAEPVRRLIRGGHVVTMDPALGDIPDADILIVSGRIVAVGQMPHVDDAEIIDATGKIVLPGLVDTHRHTWQSQLRGLAVDCTAPQYRQRIRHGYAPAYRPEDVYAGTLLGVLEALDAGITTLVDWAHIMNTPEHADASLAALTDGGIRAVFAYGTPNDANARDWYDHSTLPHPADIARVRDRYFATEQRLLTLAMGARPPHNVTPEVMLADWQLARELGIRITVDGVGRGRWSGLRHSDLHTLQAAGLLGSDTTYVHGNQLSTAEIRLIADSGGSSSIAPEVELNCGHGMPATGRLLAAGIRPGLSTDVPAMSSADLFTVMRVALAAERVRITQAAERSGSWPDQWEVRAGDMLELATLAGARACGLDDRIGSLSPGKRADLVIIDGSGPNLTPAPDPVAAVVCFAGVRDVETVLVDGEVVKRNGRLVGDLARARELAQASRAWLDERAAATDDDYDWTW